ncbi:Transposon Tf2-11 polyprotein [Dictyocoela roeselum]|nr:Transposon Tf2-11 polyprotein [Dictyocoela roeselum]
MCFADGELMEKSKILSADCYKLDLNKTVDKYKSKNHKIGDINATFYSISLTDKFNKILPEYPVPLGIRDDVTSHINELIKLGIIRESQSNFVSPAFVIKKKNGKLRLVVDYRYLNSITKKNSSIHS